jgi:hypothetical protein
MQTAVSFLSSTGPNNLPEIKVEKNNNCAPTDSLLFSNATGDTYFSCSIICRSDGRTMVIPQNTMGNAYFNYFSEQISPFFKKAVGNLLNMRKHLALQLDLEYGNITEEYFLEEEKNCLPEVEKIPFENLKKEVGLLYKFTNLPLDSEEISGILNCSIDDAEKAIRKVLLKD